MTVRRNDLRQPHAEDKLTIRPGLTSQKTGLYCDSIRSETWTMFDSTPYTGGAIMTGYDRITFDPQILGGRACIRGMRLSVSLLVNLVANGMTVEQILKEYPLLEAADVRQALQYAAALTNEELHPLTGSPL